MENGSKYSLFSSTNSSSISAVTADNNLEQTNLELSKNIESLCKSREKPRNAFVKLPANQVMVDEQKSSERCIGPLEAYCKVKLDAILKLKESTKQLLCLLEQIQAKTHTKHVVHDDTPKFSNIVKPISEKLSGTIDTVALSRLKNCTRYLDTIYIQEEHDDCSVYKRLTRKCHCLNHPDYNDLIIHFNEDSKYTTSTLGEMIKNMRILRKFLYMGGTYTKNALLFLNEGMMESQHSEKVEITQACTHADICNIFEEHSIVVVCISWPCKYKFYGDYVTQALAAEFLNKLAELEEGRRYLNYSSKITNDMRKLLRKKSALLETNTVQSLNATLNLLKPAFTTNVAITHFNRSVYEGLGKRTINDLGKLRQYMTIDEVLIHFDILNNYSNYDNGKEELLQYLPVLLVLFKNILMEYDNSEINIMVTNILNNLVSKNMLKEKEPEENPKSLTMADTATEAISTKIGTSQIPVKKAHAKKYHKTKTGLGVSPNKFRQSVKRKVTEWEPSIVLNKSAKFTKDGNKSVIIVPIEK